MDLRALATSISGITCFSSDVQSGFLFSALPGETQHGAHFIPEAIARGAGWILTDYNHYDPLIPIPVLYDMNPTRVHTHLCSLRFKRQNPLTLVGVTGTNGKSSTTFFLQQLLNATHLKKTAYLGTAGLLRYGETNFYKNRFTTPQATELYPMLQKISEESEDCVVMEVSSHSLQRHVVDDLPFSAVGITNISHDHLDTHKNLTLYTATKMNLFLKFPEATAIINQDNPLCDQFRAISGPHIITYGFSPMSDIRCVVHDPSGALTLSFFGQTFHCFFPILFQFQISNLLCACALFVALGGTPNSILGEAIAKIESLKGRMERFSLGTREIFIDYAHTPDALHVVLSELQKHASLKNGELTVIFGCGGSRDQQKRHLMGKIAHDHADHIIITTDNCRKEDPDKIAESIMSQCPNAQYRANRKDAIIYALQSLKKNGTLLIAGKGDETVQILQHATIPFSDADVTQEWIHSLSQEEKNL